MTEYLCTVCGTRLKGEDVFHCPRCGARLRIVRSGAERKNGLPGWRILLWKSPYVPRPPATRHPVDARRM